MTKVNEIYKMQMIIIEIGEDLEHPVIEAGYHNN